MTYFKKTTQHGKIPFIIVIIYFYILNFQIYPQVMPEWKIFNTSNSPLLSNNIDNISVDNFNNKWIAAGGELYKISGDDFTDFSNWTLIQNLPSGVSVIQADQNGNLWMGSGLGYQAVGLIKYDGNTFTVYNTQNSLLPYDLISGIAVDLNNNIWIMDGMENVTSQIYLVEFDQNNNWFQLSGNFGYQTWGDLAGIDSSDHIWTSTEFKLTRVNTITHEISEWNTIGLGQYVSEVKSDFKGNIWIAGGMAGWGDLVRFDGQNFTHFFNYQAVSLAVDDQKNLWVGTESLIEDTLKLLKFDGTDWLEITPYNSSLPNAFRISNLEFDKNGNLWIATEDSGIAVYKPGGLVIPVELVSFSAAVNENSVILSWKTATETNNKGFEIQRSEVGGQKSEAGGQKSEVKGQLTGGEVSLVESVGLAGVQRPKGGWEKIAFVEGNGTTSESKTYSFKDNNIKNGSYSYRLKQIDFDGTYKYSNIVEVNVNTQMEYSLSQNYPNPFNPATKIKYSIPSDGFVTLTVYNVIGQKVAELVKEVVKAGTYEVNFDASKLSSGVYYYKLEMNGFVSAKKMILLR